MKERIVGDKKNGECVSWSPLSLWCSPGYSSITQSTVHDWLAEREGGSESGKKGRERGGTQWGIHRPAMTCTQGFPFYSI